MRPGPRGNRRASGVEFLLRDVAVLQQVGRNAAEPLLVVAVLEIGERVHRLGGRAQVRPCPGGDERRRDAVHVVAGKSRHAASGTGSSSRCGSRRSASPIPGRRPAFRSRTDHQALPVRPHGAAASRRPHFPFSTSAEGDRVTRQAAGRRHRAARGLRRDLVDGRPYDMVVCVLSGRRGRHHVQRSAAVGGPPGPRGGHRRHPGGAGGGEVLAITAAASTAKRVRFIGPCVVTACGHLLYRLAGTRTGCQPVTATVSEPWGAHPGLAVRRRHDTKADVAIWVLAVALWQYGNIEERWAATAPR